jgi:hypothetical protein
MQGCNWQLGCKMQVHPFIVGRYGHNKQHNRCRDHELNDSSALSGLRDEKLGSVDQLL